MKEYLEKQSVEHAVLHHSGDAAIVAVREIEPARVIPVDLLKQLLLQYFDIGGDCYTYELMRVKEAFEIGTMTTDDFVEWDELQIDDMIAYIEDNAKRIMKYEFGTKEFGGYDE